MLTQPSPSPGVGHPVRVRKEQKILGKPKYPGRTGRLQRLHPYTVDVPFPEQLWYVELEPTARAAARVETFFGHQLEVVENANLCSASERR